MLYILDWVKVAELSLLGWSCGTSNNGSVVRVACGGSALMKDDMLQNRQINTWPYMVVLTGRVSQASGKLVLL
jgi:hypothetical protein